MSAIGTLYKQHYLYFGFICLVIIGSLQCIFIEFIEVTSDFSPVMFPTLTIFLMVFHLFIACFMAMKYWCGRRRLHLLVFALAFAGSAVMMTGTLKSFPSWLAALQMDAINYNDTLIYFTFRNILLTVLFISATLIYSKRDTAFTRKKYILITGAAILFTLSILLLSWLYSSHSTLATMTFELINNHTRKFQNLWVHKVNIVLIALWIVTLFVVLTITRLRSVFWYSISFVCICYIMTLVTLLCDEGSESAAWYSARLFETSATMLIIFTLLYDVFSLYRDSRHKYKETYQDAIRDPLTRLYNRRYFYDVLAHRLRKVTQNAPLSLIMGDVDHFKAINDTYGHLHGDKVLKRVAAQFVESVRADDIVARTGGEEFVILLNGTSGDVAKQIAERIRAKVASYHREGIDGMLTGPVTVSIGVFTVDSPLLSPEACVEHADKAMYQAKRSGRDRVVVFE